MEQEWRVRLRVMMALPILALLLNVMATVYGLYQLM